MSADETAIDAMLTFTTFAVCGFGPAGFVLGGLVASLQTVFGACMRGDDTSRVDIQTVVHDALGEDRVVDAAKSFQAYATWFKNIQDTADGEGGFTPIPSDPGSLAAYRYLGQAVTDPNSPLLQNLSAVQSTSEMDYAAEALPWFMYGVSIHLAMFKAYLLIEAFASDRSFNRTDTLLMLEYTEQYVAYVKKVVGYIQGRIRDRLAQVSEVKEGTSQVGAGPWSTSVSCRYFTDSGTMLPGWHKGDEFATMTPNTVSFKNNSGAWLFWSGTPHPEKVEADRKQYIEQLTKQQEKEFNYTRADSIQASVDKWQVIAGGLRSIIHASAMPATAA